MPNPLECEQAQDLLQLLKTAKAEFDAAYAKAIDTGDFKDTQELRKKIEQRLGSLREKVGSVSVASAEKIMGQENVLTPLELFGVIPSEKIPFNRQELQEAATRGDELVYYPARLEGSFAFIIKFMADHVEKKNGHKYIRELPPKSRPWDHDFYTQDTPSHGWRLVSKEILEGSNKRDYWNQTLMLVSVLKERFKGKTMPEEYRSAIAEIETWKQTHNNALSNPAQNYVQVSHLMQQAKINLLLRESPAEVFYRMLLRENKSGQRPFESSYVWTRTRVNDLMISVGDFTSEGVSIRARNPDERTPGTCVAFQKVTK